jgi:hypothetical protein
MGRIGRYGENALGLDCSTKSIAFCYMEKGVPTRWGEVHLNGATAFERIYDAKCKAAAIDLTADAVAIEAAIYVNNMKASISLAYVYGAVLGELMTDNSGVIAVEPLKWQSHIGNKLWTKAQKDKLFVDNPAKAKTWYKQEVYRRRKQYTLDWVKSEYGIDIDSDNVGDAFGLARYLSDTYNG